jgi:vacuolar protein-sorting-associated protein 4
MSLALQAIGFERKARQSEQMKQLSDALAIDTHAIQLLMRWRQTCNDKTTKGLVTERLHQWLDAADVLKQKIKPDTHLQRPPSVRLTQNDNRRRGTNKFDTKQKGNTPAPTGYRAPPHKWSDVVGLEQAKHAITNSMVLPRQFPHLYQNTELARTTCLLYGPPGTGKSFLARVAADELDCTFYSISVSDIMSKWVGESEQTVHQVFVDARDNAPSVLFFDEIDAITSSRGENMADGSRRVVSQLLVEMDGVGYDNTGVLILGATNHPWDIDAAILRRFTVRVFVDLPDTKSRSTLLRQLLPADAHAFDADQLTAMAEQTQGYSGADLRAVINGTLLRRGQLLQEACFFYQEDGCWRPCTSDHPQAQSYRVDELPSKQVRFALLVYDDVLDAIRSHPPAPNQQLERYASWGQS